MSKKEPKLLFCGVRDALDVWHTECRFDDGQKFAAIEVDYEHEDLADTVAWLLNNLKRLQLFAKQRNQMARALLSVNYTYYDYDDISECAVCGCQTGPIGYENHHPGCAIVEARKILGRR